MGAVGGGAGLSGNEGLATYVAAVAAADSALTVTNVVDGDGATLPDEVEHRQRAVGGLDRAALGNG
jgi:hypothetical protein